VAHRRRSHGAGQLSSTCDSFRRFGGNMLLRVEPFAPPRCATVLRVRISPHSRVRALDDGKAALVGMAFITITLILKTI
jgi:hypothetical protein